MSWTVVALEPVLEWYEEMDDGEKERFIATIDLVRQFGPTLGHPHSSAIKGATTCAMRELRYQHRGRPYRVLYAFDPRRQAVLLVGGDKTGDERWYRKHIPWAESLFQAHLADLEP